MPEKRWPAAHYQHLVDQLLERTGGTVFVVGDKLDRDLLTSRSERIVVAAGDLSLRETAQLIQRCELFIGNDSGLLHIASAVGVRSVSFFGPTSPHGKTPDWLAHRVLRHEVPCSPCYRYGYAPACPYGLKCLTQISPDQAVDAALDLLRSAHA